MLDSPTRTGDNAFKVPTPVREAGVVNVGDEIDTTCPRCKLILTHVILYFDEHGAIDGVECRTCGARHTYRSSRRGRIRRPPPSPKTVKALIEGGSFAQRHAQLDPRRILPYRTDPGFSDGDAIEHPRFGVGFVLRVRDDRIEVLFEDGIKVLVHGRSPAPR